MHRLGLALLVGLCVSVVGARADVYPPFQFRVIDPKGKVELRPASGPAQVIDSRARPVEGDVVATGDSGTATLQVANFGMIFLYRDTQLRIAQVGDGGKPFLDLMDGGVLIKTRRLGGLEPVTVSFAQNQVAVRDGFAELLYKGDRKVALLSVVSGSADLTTPEGSKSLSGSTSQIRGDGKFRTKDGVAKGKVLERWDHVEKLVEAQDLPAVPDEQPPQVKLLSPRPGATHPTSQIEVYGTVDDPTVTQVQVKVDGAHQVFSKVVDGQFRSTVILRKATQTVAASATDEAGNTGQDSVVAKCSAPAAPLAPEEPETPPSFTERAMETIKNPKKDPQFFAMLMGGLLVFVVLLMLLIGRIMKMFKKGAETAAGLATGVMFHRCEKCGEREYEYHLFYTTEKVTSPFMRNLINNVNPMATSIMNESLENLLNTGLQGTAGAKSAEQKIRVTCTWCDNCKVGNLKLEHMQDQDVSKTDDYQIIHPIFIEWVRKVYD